MKFHWADFLDRESGLWHMVPNDERGHYYTGNCADLPDGTSIVTVTKNTENIDALANLATLEELTLHETNQQQIEQLRAITQIKRLRITHARTKTLNALALLQNVEELVLEYVSGFSDVSPLGEMSKLRALHIENLRGVSDFTPLGQANGLQYLSIMGTFDWAQPVDSIAFCTDLSRLEYLSLCSARLVDFDSAKALVSLGAQCDFRSSDNLFPLEIFAHLEAHSPKAKFKPVTYRYAMNPAYLSEDDPRALLSEEKIAADHPDVIIVNNGRMFFSESEYDWYELLGRGARKIAVTSKDAAKRAAIYEKKYRDLVEEARNA